MNTNLDEGLVFAPSQLKGIQPISFVENNACARPPYPGWVLVNVDFSPYHTSGVCRWVPPDDPAVTGERRQGHVGISASWESDPSHPIHEERMRGGHTIGPLKKWELGQQMTPEHLHELIAVERGHLRPIRLTTTTVPKGWGHELHVCNNNEFCGKELHVRAGHKFSAHFHIKKREVFRLRTGSVELTTINMEDASRLITIMNPGDVIEIPRYLPHSIKALEDSIIDEYSTMDTPGDSYRVEPGSSQTKTQCPTQSTTNPLP